MGSFSSESRPRGANAANGRSRLAAVNYTNADLVFPSVLQIQVDKHNRLYGIYLCGGFTDKRSDFPRVTGRNTPPSFMAVQQTVVIATGKGDETRL